MSVLLLFLDGVGLGDDDPSVNPLARAEMPVLSSLLDGKRLLRTTGPMVTGRAGFIPTGATLGVPGRPQSATGQTTILTGVNAAQLIGEHWGPKPDARLRRLLEGDTLFRRVVAAGRRAALLNAYPSAYFASIERGHRLLSAVPLAATAAGLPLFTADDLYAGRALAADFTGDGWRSRLGYTDVPVLTLRQAGSSLAELARQYDFSFFEYWPTDVLGHRASLEEAVMALKQLDAVLGGLLEAWDDTRDLLVVTSDHGNLEDLSHRHHTLNPVPTILVGKRSMANAVRPAEFELMGIAPLILAALDLERVRL